jgi:hypothetical protein
MMALSKAPKKDVFSFRLDPAMNAAFAESAAAAQTRPAELLLELMREHIAATQRLAFEDEARRQRLAFQARASEPHSDEAQVMREHEAELEAFAREWK